MILSLRAIGLCGRVEKRKGKHTRVRFTSEGRE